MLTNVWYSLIAVMLGRLGMSVGDTLKFLKVSHSKLVSYCINLFLNQAQDYATKSKRPAGRRRSRQPSSMYMLPGKLHQSHVNALPDTGADRNAISLDLAQKLGFWMDTNDQHTFVLPNNCKMQSLGTVTETFYFDGEHDPHIVKFDVLRDSPYELILGDLFLSHTETLKKYSHRLRKTPVPNPRIRPFCNMDRPRSRLVGVLDGEVTVALPDTGCMVNLISMEYARAHGLQSSIDTSDRGYLRYADGHVEPTLGSMTLPWAFADQSNRVLDLDFEVVADCRYDVVLGQEILLDEHVYRDHAESFVNLPNDDDEEFEMSPVSWTPNWVEKLNKSKRSSKNIGK